MTTKPASRKTLADLFPLISQADIPEKAKADMASAVRKVAKVIGTNPALLPVDAQSLRRRLETVSHQLAGVSQGRWNNIRSLLGKALALATPILPGRSYTPLTPAWQTLVDRLEFGRRTRLLPLMRRFSELEISPDKLTLADLEAYRVAICEDRLRSNPESTWDSLAWSWNACVREIPEWPQIAVPRKAKREIYSFPWDYYPPSLHEEVQAYLRHIAGHDLSEDSPESPARPATLETRERQLRMAAAAAIHKGVPRDQLTSLKELLTIDRYVLILQFFKDRSGGKSSPQTQHMAYFLKTVLRHHLKLDDDALIPFEKINRQINPKKKRRGLTRKNRERLRPFDDPDVVKKFLELPWRIRKDVEEDKKSPIKRRALRAQLAVAIAILQIIPVRRKNIHEIEIDKHLIARGKHLYLVFEEDETKTEEPIDFEIPTEYKDLIAWYVREYRPHLLRTQTNALFPGEGAKPKSGGTLAEQVKKIIFDYLGLPFNLHLFRHAGTKIYLDVRPGQYGIPQRVLGHRSSTTTMSVYAGTETKAAGLHFASVLRERRLSSELPERVRPPRPKIPKNKNDKGSDK